MVGRRGHVLHGVGGRRKGGAVQPRFHLHSFGEKQLGDFDQFRNALEERGEKMGVRRATAGGCFPRATGICQRPSYLL